MRGMRRAHGSGPALARATVLVRHERNEQDRPVTGRRNVRVAAAFLLLPLLLLARSGTAFPIDGDQAALPAGSELNEDALDVPREVLRSEYRGDRISYVVALGDLAFNSPAVLGDVARRANISCGTCHVNGAGNAKLFVPIDP